MTTRVILAEQIAEAERWLAQRRRETAEGVKLKVMTSAFAERQVALAAGIVKTLRWMEKHEPAIKASAVQLMRERGE